MFACYRKSWQVEIISSTLSLFSFLLGEWVSPVLVPYYYVQNDKFPRASILSVPQFLIDSHLLLTVHIPRLGPFRLSYLLHDDQKPNSIFSYETAMSGINPTYCLTARESRAIFRFLFLCCCTTLLIASAWSCKVLESKTVVTKCQTRLTISLSFCFLIGRYPDSSRLMALKIEDLSQYSWGSDLYKEKFSSCLGRTPKDIMNTYLVFTRLLSTSLNMSSRLLALVIDSTNSCMWTGSSGKLNSPIDSLISSRSSSLNECFQFESSKPRITNSQGLFHHELSNTTVVNTDQLTAHIPRVGLFRPWHLQHDGQKPISISWTFLSSSIIARVLIRALGALSDILGRTRATLNKIKCKKKRIKRENCR